MAIFRSINMTFWTDTKVVDNYTPEDRYFMMYALTNPYTNIIGCYEISIKQIANDLGYKEDIINNLISRFKNIHKNIDYDYETKELLVLNWCKYNWSASPKLDSSLYNSIEKVKSNLFHDKLAKIYNNRETVIEKVKENDMVSIPYRYGIDTTNSIANTNTNANTNANTNTNSNTNTNIFNKHKDISSNKVFKHVYGEYKHVLLSDQELENLKKTYTYYLNLIKYLDEYIEMKGYKAKNHYLCIKKWVNNAYLESRKKDNKNLSASEQRQQLYKEMEDLYDNNRNK